MLETIHEYAAEKLGRERRGRGGQAGARRYFLALAEEAEPELGGRGADSVDGPARSRARQPKGRPPWSHEGGEAELGAQARRGAVAVLVPCAAISAKDAGGARRPSRETAGRRPPRGRRRYRDRETWR